MGVYLSDLADVLRDAGCTVAELAGWETAAFPAWGGYLAPPTHVMCHHTASPANTDPFGDLNYITHIHPLRPICNLYLSRTGTFHVVAGGQVCTNGAGHDWWGGGVADNTMNRHAISIEAANNGAGEPWSATQCAAYTRGVAALCTAYHIAVDHVRAHHEWATGRKIDPAGPTPARPLWGGITGARSWDMGAFRASVQTDLDEGSDTMKVRNPSTREYDTRTNHPLLPGETRTVTMKATGSAVMVNVTVVDPTETGFLTVWGTGANPKTPTIRYEIGQDIANAVIVPLAANHTIRVASSARCHVLVDIYAVWP